MQQPGRSNDAVAWLERGSDATAAARRPARAVVTLARVAAAIGLVVLVGAGALLALRVVPGAGVGPDVPRFVDETGTAGLDHTYDGDYQDFTGGGVAVFDCDGDGRPDVYVGGGSHPAGLFRNESRTGGALRFARVDAPEVDEDGVLGAYPIDVDGDGVTDLAVLRIGGSTLYRGIGGCRFAPFETSLGVQAQDGWITAFSATWEGSATLPTLAFGRYVTLDANGEPAGCGDNALVRPDATGTRYAAAVALSPGWCTLSMLFSDWDRSGRRDLRVSNDRQYYRDGEEQLWRVATGEAPRLYTAADGWASVQIWGMGIASQDVTGDGLPDVYLTSQGDNKLQTLASGSAEPAYRDIALERGVTAAQPYAGGQALPSTAWHPEFSDVNDDGLPDLFVSKGNVSAMPDYASKDPSNLLVGQPDGTFVERGEAAGIATFDKGRGAALADLNLDGLPDLLLVNLGASMRAWRNVGAGTAASPVAMGHWLEVRLTQPGGNRDAIGATIEVEAGDAAVQRRELVVGGGHLGGQLGWTHVGLGQATRARVRATWPDGELGPWLEVAADQLVDIARGATEAVPWTPPEG